MVNTPHCLLLLPRKGAIHAMYANLLLDSRIALAYSDSDTTEQYLLCKGLTHSVAL